MLGAFSDEVATALKRVVLEKVYLSSNSKDDDLHILGMIEQYTKRSEGTGGKKASEARADRSKSAAPLATAKLPGASPKRTSTHSIGSGLALKGGGTSQPRRKKSSLLPGLTNVTFSPTNPTRVVGLASDGPLTGASDMCWARSEEMMENCQKWDFDVIAYVPRASAPNDRR